MTPKEAIDYIFEKRKPNDEKLFDAIVIVKREVERSVKSKTIHGLLLSKLVHYSEQVGRLSHDDRDEDARTVMASKQQAILEVLMEVDA